MVRDEIDGEISYVDAELNESLRVAFAQRKAGNMNSAMNDAASRPHPFVTGRLKIGPQTSSNAFSGLHSTISRDNTEGESARQAKLLAEFAQKHKKIKTSHTTYNLNLDDHHTQILVSWLWDLVWVSRRSQGAMPPS